MSKEIIDPATPVDADVPSDVTLTQTADTPGNDENGDGLKGGQATANNHGDVLGL
jgi:hypothetical protein